MKDFGSRSSRIRTPVKGLRQRLRIALRTAGVVGKFRTDHIRARQFDHYDSQTLVVMSKEFIKLPFHSFDGHVVCWQPVKGVI